MFTIHVIIYIRIVLSSIISSSYFYSGRSLLVISPSTSPKRKFQSPVHGSQVSNPKKATASFSITATDAVISWRGVVSHGVAWMPVIVE